MPRNPLPSPAAAAPPRIRPAMAADLPRVAAILAARAGAADASDLPSVTTMRERLVVQGYPCLVAAEGAGEGGAVLGFAFAAPFALRAVGRGTVEGVVCTDPAAAGQGVGRALLSALIEACAAKGFRTMVAVVTGAGAEAEAAVALHRALGFAQAGVLRGVGLRLGAPVDSVLMQRSLEGAGAVAPPRRAA
jgi:phosphinothricin acetyltransferase